MKILMTFASHSVEFEMGVMTPRQRESVFNLLEAVHAKTLVEWSMLDDSVAWKAAVAEDKTKQSLATWSLVKAETEEITFASGLLDDYASRWAAPVLSKAAEYLRGKL